MAEIAVQKGSALTNNLEDNMNVDFCPLKNLDLHYLHAYLENTSIAFYQAHLLLKIGSLYQKKIFKQQ